MEYFFGLSLIVLASMIAGYLLGYENGKFVGEELYKAKEIRKTVKLERQLSKLCKL